MKLLIVLLLLAGCGKGSDESFSLDGKLVDGKPTLHLVVKRKPGASGVTANAKAASRVAIGYLDAK